MIVHSYCISDSIINVRQARHAHAVDYETRWSGLRPLRRGHGDACAGDERARVALWGEGRAGLSSARAAGGVRYRRAWGAEGGAGGGKGESAALAGALLCG